MDGSGKLVRFTAGPGNAAECKELTTLLDGISTHEVIADKAYDTDAIRLYTRLKSLLFHVLSPFPAPFLFSHPPNVNRL